MYSLNKLFIYFSISIIVWIFTNNILNFATTSIIVLLILIVLFFNFYIYVKNFWKYLILIIIWLIIWIWVSNYNINNIIKKEDFLNKYTNNKTHNIEIEIKNIYNTQEYNYIYSAKLLTINWKTINKNVNWLFYIPKNYKLEKWNIIWFNSKILKFQNIENFKYKEYMLTKNLYFKSYIYSFENIKNKKLNIVEKNISKIRNFFINTIREIYPNEEAIFLWWILIWARENIPLELKNDFNNSWLTHIIAVSWFNITILIVFLSFLLKTFPVFIKSILISFFIIFFAMLVWDSASVVRASIMWIIWYNILVSWRQWSSLAIISLTALFMLLYSPLSINYDVSFHLSFLAVLWIIYTQKFFSKIFYFLPDFLEIKNAFTLTLSALTFTLPIIFFNFGQVSIISPLANIAVWWTLPISMLLGFISIFVYYVFNIAWIFIWYLTWIFLKWDISVIHFFWKQEWSLIQYDFWIYKNYIEIIYFIILIFVIIYFRKKEA